MSEEQSRPPRRRRRWRWLLALALAFPVFLVAALDLWFSLPWGRAWIGGKLTRRAHLPVTIGACYWTPWSGVVVSDVEVAAPVEGESSSPVPLLRVPQIQVDLNWLSCLRRQPMFDRVVIDSPELTLTPETLKALVASRASEPPALDAPTTAPPLAGVDAPTGQIPRSAPGPGLSPGLATPGTPPVLPGPEAAAPASHAAVEKPALPPAVDTRPGAVVEIRHAHFRLLGSHGAEPLAEIRGFDLDAPVQGKEASGHASLAELDVGGRPLAQGVRLPLQWKSPELQALDQTVEMAGLRLQVTFRFGRLPGLPFLLEVRCPAQALAFIQAPLERKISAKRVQGVAQFGGALPVPGTWQGLMLGAGENLRLDGPGKPVNFSRGQGNFFFRDGVARCPDLRLIGDDFSILGNGIAGHGEIAGTLRWVVPQETVDLRLQKLNRLNPQWRAVFSPLETPERTYIDLNWVTHRDAPGIELGEGGSVLTPAEFAAWMEG